MTSESFNSPGGEPAAARDRFALLRKVRASPRRSASRRRDGLKPENWLSAVVAIASIVLTSGYAYWSQDEARTREIAVNLKIEAGRTAVLYFDSAYLRLSQEMRAVSDRRKTTIGAYRTLDSADLTKRIAESNSVDDSWRESVGLWDFRIRRYAGPSVVAGWTDAVRLLTQFGSCVEQAYSRWEKSHYNWLPNTTCSADSTEAAKAFTRFRDSAVVAFRRENGLSAR